MAINLRGSNESTYSNDVSTVGNLSAATAELSGTTTGYALEVESQGTGDANEGGIRITSSADNDFPFVVMTSGGTATAASFRGNGTCVFASGLVNINNQGFIRSYHPSSTASDGHLQLSSDVGGDDTVTFRVEGNGTLLIGGTLPATPNIRLNATGAARFQNTTGGTTTNINISPNWNGSGARDLIHSNGVGDLRVRCGSNNGVDLAPGATSWASSSDIRLKQNLEPITDGLNKVSLLRALTGQYITDEPEVSRAFLIAQDVQKVLPQAVHGDEGNLKLAYTELIPLLVSALHDAKDRIEALEAEVQSLKGGN